MNDNIWYSVDFETSNQNRYTAKIDRVCVRSFKIDTGEVVWEDDFNFRLRDERCSTLLNHAMASPRPKVMHLAGFDLYLMENRLGIPVNGPVHDTYLMAKHWKNDLPAYSLKALVWTLFGDTYQPLLKLREWTHKHKIKGEDDLDFDMTRPPDKLIHNYCMYDDKMTAKIAQFLYPEVKNNYAYQIDTACIRHNMDMEVNGITIDVPVLKKMVSLAKRRIKRNKGQAGELMKIEKGRSPLGLALRDHVANLGEVSKTKTKLTRIDEPTLRKWKKDKVVRAALRAKTDNDTIIKFGTALLTVVGKGNSFHPNLVQSAAVTRRHRAWNLYGDNGLIVKGQPQNVPRGPGIRSVYTVPPGYWFSKMDLASIEARMFSSFMEFLMGESLFADMYRKNLNFNPYLFVIERCTSHGKLTKKHELYIPFKHGVLGRTYASGPARLSKQLRNDFDLDYSEDDCHEIYRMIDQEFPFIKRYQRFLIRLVEEQGYLLDVFGAIYYGPKDGSYKAIAHLHQGAAAMVLRWWWIEIEKLMKKSQDYLFLTCHDEFDGAIHKEGGKRKANQRVKGYCDCLKGLDLFNLPICAEASGLVNNWSEAK